MNLKQLIQDMKVTFHREYFSGISEKVLIDSIEEWMKAIAEEMAKEIYVGPSKQFSSFERNEGFELAKEAVAYQIKKFLNSSPETK